MTGGRYVVLVVELAGSPGLSGEDPTEPDGLPGVEVVRCTDVDQAFVLLAGSRPWSAVLLDGPVASVAQDLVGAARRAGVPTLWSGGGRSVPGTLVVARSGGELLAALSRWCQPIPWANQLPGPAIGGPAADAGADGFGVVGGAGASRQGGTGADRVVGGTGAIRQGGAGPDSMVGGKRAIRQGGAGPDGVVAGTGASRQPVSGHPSGGAGTAPPGRLVAVCGPGGTGASTVAMALAGGLGRMQPGTLLADLALRAGQAVLHGIHAPAATIDDLIHAYRFGTPSVADFTMAVGGRPYRLLAGLRRTCHWTAIGPLAFDSALADLACSFPLIVADITGDFEGESESGSLDLEDRNHMARRVAETADLVVLVGNPGSTGRRAMDQTVEALASRGVAEDRLFTVVNRTSVTDRPDALALPQLRPDNDPATWARPITGAVASFLDKRPPRAQEPPVLVPVLPGSIGHW